MGIASAGLIAGGLLLAAAGCASDGGKVAASPVRDTVLADIPKPQGFRLVDDRSMAKATGKFRVARCEYQGSARRDVLKRFYEEYMPSAGFTLREWSLDGGKYWMRFESSAEVCNIRIGPAGRGTSVIVEVAPKAQGSADRSNEPSLRRPVAP
ncbi:MAG: hypothetical protein D6744_12145 [Planctomycetota bacterium]|nr:MAG: hypothetical protein D6744_12145 [Planctomycetota bacterium]